MSDESIKIDLDPKKVLDALQEMAEESKRLSAKIEDALGKEAPKSIAKMEDAAERGTAKVSSSFRNLGTRLKDDLKSAFDVGKVLTGVKALEGLAHGTKQVLDMERAFDRLNTRLGLTSRQMQDFKRQLGSGVAATGQKLEDVLPGVENAASKGNIKSPAELSSIAEALAKARATTNEDTGGLSDTVTEIIKAQGQKVTGKSFKDTLDALQATRVQGAFGTAGEAGHAVEQLAPYAKKLGLNTRDLGGLAATASKSGAAGQDILRQLLEKGTTVGGQQQINAAFGTQLFKHGKLDSGAFGGIKKNQFGQYSQQVMEQASGLTGANGADLSRFIDSMKGGMDTFKKVANGANETADQFNTATDNLASKIDKFKEGAKEAGREVGESIAVVGKDILKGDFKQSFKDIGGVGKSAWDNKGTLLGTAGLALGGAVLAGSGAKGLLGKIPGVGGLVGGEAAKAMGITPVYVTNAKEIGGGSNMVDDFLSKTTSMGGAKKAGGLLAKFGGMASAALPYAGYAAAAGAVGYAALSSHKGPSEDDEMSERDRLMKEQAQGGGGSDMSKDIAAAVQKGAHDGVKAAMTSQKPNYTNPSEMTYRGRGQ